MKTLKTILKALAIILIAISVGLWLFLNSKKPDHSGTLILPELKDKVEVLFDNHGVPHIYAENEEDAYQALGYVHAQDRLFQMEIMRRVGGGRLAEILGVDLIAADRFFKTIGIDDAADISVIDFEKDMDTPWNRGALAYIKGVNHFINNGPTPLEFTLLGIKKEDYTAKDMFLIAGYMSFSFAHGFRTDPIVTKIKRDLGIEYLNDLAVHWDPGDEMMHNYSVPDSTITDAIALQTTRLVDRLPAPVFLGSNGWVLGPEKTKSGQVLFANDTHISFAQPSVWYEAHIECPEFSFYGNHLAGYPYGLVGHTRRASIGLTMFENDDVDFYVEKQNPENENQVWENDHWADMKIVNKTIKVKGSKDVQFDVKTTRHGPLVNGAMEDIDSLGSTPVSVWWAYTKFPNNTLKAAYGFAHSNSMTEAKEAAFSINAPGLNVMYGDIEGNIAWWAVAKLIKRPDHVNSKAFLDGASGNDEPTGVFQRTENPQSENPPQGFVYSANNQPDTIFANEDSGKGTLYPGYYVPEDRAKSINKHLRSDVKWDTESMKKMSTDVISSSYPSLASNIMTILENESILQNSSNHIEAAKSLINWDGSHETEDIAPTIYNKLIYNILHNAMADEISTITLDAFLSTHMMKRSTKVLINNESSVWWDNINTKDIKETRIAMLIDAFDRSIRDLEDQLGQNIQEWKWGLVHKVEHIHPIGRKEPFDKIFNVGPIPIKGGNEVINNLGYTLNGSGWYQVTYGPAMRIIIDFSDVENALSILPTGQSGNVMSDYYDNQAQMYADGSFRKMLMNKEDIEKNQIGTMTLEPN